MATLPTIPQGSGNWTGYEYTYSRIAMACRRMALTPAFMTPEYVNAMFVLACGHEETMRAEMARLKTRGFLQ